MCNPYHAALTPNDFVHEAQVLKEQQAKTAANYAYMLGLLAMIKLDYHQALYYFAQAVNAQPENLLYLKSLEEVSIYLLKTR